jgi:molybdenum-dependent DNA-binding transcriptional regulator ModE
MTTKRGKYSRRNKTRKTYGGKNKTKTGKTKTGKRWVTAIDAATHTLNKTGSINAAKRTLKKQALFNARKLFGSV